MIHKPKHSVLMDKIGSRQHSPNLLLTIQFFIAIVVFLSVSYSQASWNDPYSEVNSDKKVLYSNFGTPPKHLDPVVSYSSNEWAFLGQIYEPPLQYHYFKRPYSLQPLTLKSMPEQHYFDEQGNILASDQSAKAAFTEYHFYLRDDVRFQPHPAFVKQGEQFLYHQLSAEQLQSISSINDLPQAVSRKLVAADYVYAIKRMALRQNHSPILDSMNQYIVGLKEFSDDISKRYEEQLKNSDKSVKVSYFDLNAYQIEGVKIHSDSHFSIKIKGLYPQFLYWLTMNFFAPIPWEADKFYKQKGLVEKNITLDTSPVGTGPYYLAENNPNQVMRLKKNPNFHDEFYPDDGLPYDANQLLLADAGKKLPLIDEVVYTLEKESVPLWNKFLQGYYDASGVSSESFDQAVSISSVGDIALTDQMRDKGIQFLNAVQPSIFYLGFNMADPVVGGYSEQQQKLRQAISIAINYEEYISIFLNGRGIAAQGPVPPGIFGFDEGSYNPYVYKEVDGRIQRRSIDEAKSLLAEAGYPGGKLEDGTSLKLYYDTSATGPDSQSRLNWYRKQFAKLGIELVIRATDYNRFQSKVRGAKVQLFSWGWNADYPDPENFMFLLFGDNAAINTNGAGINSANYDQAQFNELFTKMKRMPNSEERLQIVQQMTEIVQKDSPWVWGLHPKSLVLYHSWLQNVWPNSLANNTLKYRNLDSEARADKQQRWNQPVLWPIVLVVVLILLSIVPLMYAYRQRQMVKVGVSVNLKQRGGR
ncbi:ABC transporter substrate-binding protein [Thiomicrorhabdus marina]|nr:ABC transporter substrate-binding protein [Thiomicrorhabdus marina]